MKAARIDCILVAPSLIPLQAGNRIKTDRRDARKLAHFLRSGDLTEIFIPDEEAEAIRDLERSREDAKKAQRVARQQLGNFLLRHDRRWPDSNWTRKHLDWIHQQKFPHQAQQRVLVDYIKTVEEASEREEQLVTDLAELIRQTKLYPLIIDSCIANDRGRSPVSRLEPLEWRIGYAKINRAWQAFRGIRLITAVARELAGFIWAVGQEPVLLAEE